MRPGMLVEIFENGQWMRIATATATHVSDNHYRIEIPGFPIFVRLTALDGRVFRIAGRQTTPALGSSMVNGTLTLEVLLP